MHCPACGDDDRTDATTCADCGVTLVPGDFGAAKARVGRFHPTTARLVVRLAERHQLGAETITQADGIDVLVNRAAVEPIRAELVVSWEELLRELSVDEQAEVITRGGPLPGWIDPPDGLWVDRQGRLLATDEQPDEGRALGPVLMSAGGLLLLASWYAGEGTLAFIGVIGGLALLVVGVFSPR